MDLVSLGQGFEVTSELCKKDGSALVGGLDLNSAVDKDEKTGDYVYENLTMNDQNLVDLNENKQHASPPVHADFRHGNAESHDQPHSSAAAEFHHDVILRADCIDSEERLHSPPKDNHCEGEMEKFESNYFHISSPQIKEEVFKMEMKNKNSPSLQDFPLTRDANQSKVMEDNSDVDGPTSPPHEGTIKISEYEDIEMEAIDYQTKKKFSSPTEGRKSDIPYPDQQLLQRTAQRSNSPRRVRQISISPERPYTLLSPSGKKSLKQGVCEPPHSSRLHRQKHTSLPESSDLDKRASSHDRKHSASPRHSLQGLGHKDGSSLKHIPPPSRARDPSPKHRRQDRSVSRSPIRRRDSSSGYKRHTRDRSRSKSPHTRDHRRRSPRRYSPRHRSPLGYHSRHRSPRRQWSPPPNRSTGVGKPGKNLFVAGFSFLTTERDLERKFSRFGRVRDVRIVRDKRSGDSRGFGFLSLERDEEADAAIRALDKTEWNGRIVLVEKSKTSGR